MFEMKLNFPNSLIGKGAQLKSCITNTGNPYHKGMREQTGLVRLNLKLL